MMQEELKSLWLTETVRLIEKESATFFDEDANRQARHMHGPLEQRIITRALILSKQNGLIAAQSQLIKAIKISFIILLIFSVMIGVTLALSSVSQNPINLYWALFSLLGVHLVTLFIWLITTLTLSSGSGSIFIYCWLWLTEKLSAKQTIKQLIPSFISLFGRKIRWLIGFAVNLFWTFILLSALFVLIMVFSTKYYSFEWKTTLLTPDWVISITHCLGQIPALIGFTMPNADMIRMSEHAVSADEVRSAWAIWLLGVFIVYGVIIRFALMIFCGFKWFTACRKIKLNIDSPDYQLLANQLKSNQTQIIDADNASSLVSQTDVNRPDFLSHDGAFLVAIDIEENVNLTDSKAFLGFLNTSEARKVVLDRLQQFPAKKLLIAIDTNRTPDRGILNLINQLENKSKQTRLWFINQGKQFDNWQNLSFQLGTPQWLLEE